jgi:hypothetical protein
VARHGTGFSRTAMAEMRYADAVAREVLRIWGPAEFLFRCVLACSVFFLSPLAPASTPCTRLLPPHCCPFLSRGLSSLSDVPCRASFGSARMHAGFPTNFPGRALSLSFSVKQIMPLAHNLACAQKHPCMLLVKDAICIKLNGQHCASRTLCWKLPGGDLLDLSFAAVAMPFAVTKGARGSSDARMSLTGALGTT